MKFGDEFNFCIKNILFGDLCVVNWFENWVFFIFLVWSNVDCLQKRFCYFLSSSSSSSSSGSATCN